MELISDIGELPIKEVLEAHPRIGEILGRYEIGCTDCSIGTCLLKEVVKVHFLGDEVEAKLESEINDYLRAQGG